MLAILDQNEMIEIGHIFLPQNTDIKEQDIYVMSDFDIYCKTRDMVAVWNKLPLDELNKKKLGLEVQGFLT